MIKGDMLENKRLVTIKNTSSVTLHGLPPGECKRVQVDENGIPLDPNWRRRFRDASIDKCIDLQPGKKAKETKEV